LASGWLGPFHFRSHVKRQAFFLEAGFRSSLCPIWFLCHRHFLCGAIEAGPGRVLDNAEALFWLEIHPHDFAKNLLKTLYMYDRAKLPDAFRMPRFWAGLESRLPYRGMR